MPRTAEDIEKSKQFVDLLQEFDAARKKAEKEEDERLKKKAEEEAREAQENLNQSGKKLDADDLSGLNDPQAVTDAVNRANELAHANYKQDMAANRAAYNKTVAECDAKIVAASEAYRQNGTKYDDYLKIKKEQDALMEQAYNKMEKASQEAYAKYKGQVDANHAALDKYVIARAAADEQAKRGLQEAPTLKATVVSEQFKKTVEDYNKKFQDEPWYKANPLQEKDGKLNMSFKSNQDMTSFFREQAAKNQNFILVDGATNKVMAYSKGGKFYHSNHSEVKEGDAFTPGDKAINQFRASEPRSKAEKDNEPPLSRGPDTGSAQKMADSIGSTANQLGSPPPHPTPGTEHSEKEEEQNKDGMKLR